MQAYLAAYGAMPGDRRGYRWLWRDASLSDASLSQVLSRLDTARFSDAGLLRKLLAGELDAGVLAVPEGNCVAYRFLHGGRDGAREKFHLQIGWFPRCELARLDLNALLSRPVLSVAQESRPASTTLELPVRQGPPSTVLTPQDSLSGCWGECIALPAGQLFHLRLTGSVNAPLGVLRIDPLAPSALPAVELQKPFSTPANPTVFGDSSPAHRPETRPQQNRKYMVIAFLLGLLVGLLLGRGCAPSPKAADSEPRPSATERSSLLDSNREPTRAATAPETVTPKESPGIKPQGAKPH